MLFAAHYAPDFVTGGCNDKINNIPLLTKSFQIFCQLLLVLVLFYIFNKEETTALYCISSHRMKNSSSHLLFCDVLDTGASLNVFAL